MTTRSSLGFIADATTVRLSNGSIEVNASTLTANNLQPSTTLKTDSARNIVSADLYLSDIKDYVPPGASVSNPMIENLDANGKNIENVGNLETTLINSRGILYNTSIANLNMGGFNINNSPTLTTLQDKTQYITADTKTGETIFNSSILLNGGSITNMNSILFDNGATIVADNQNLLLTSNNLITTTANIDTNFDIRCGTLTAVNISNSTFSNLVAKTQYQSVNTPLNSTVFAGIVSATTTLSVGNAQPNQTGYNLPTARPLLPGYVMVTPSSTGNTLTFQVAADPNKILNQTSVAGVSTTFTGQIIVGDAGVRYTFPNTRGTDGQYLRSEATGILSWVGPTYGQISRSNGTETIGYTLAANVMKNATTLTGTTITTHLASSDLSINVADGVIIYNGIPRILKAEISCRFRCGDAKASNGGIATLSLLQFPSTVLISNTVVTQNNTERYYMSCTNMSFYTTGFSFTFGITFDSNLTNNAFLSDISLNIISF